MERIYNKLVRDNIPKIIEEKNETPIIRILNDAEYKEALEKKLYEERENSNPGINACIDDCHDYL